MKLPKCPWWSTITRIWSTLARKLKSESYGHIESNGGGNDLLRVAMASDRAPKAVSPSTADQRPINGKTMSPTAVDGRKWKRESWGTKLRWWRGQISVRSMAVVMGFGCGFSSLKRRRSGQFPTKMTVKVWPASHKLSIDTLLGRSGGRNCEIWPGYVRGLGRVFGFVVGSVWQLLSHVHVSVFALFFQLLLF